MIHATAIIDADATLDADVEVGAYACIGAGVRIGRGSRVGAHAVIEGPTELGEDNRIGPHAVLGTPPQDTGYQGEATRLVIGHRNVVREFATIHRGSPKDRGVTTVGDDNMLMAYTHVGHDCVIGSRVILANGTMLSGHVVVEDAANISGLCGIHQFVHVGTLAMVGGGTMTTKDIPPFAMVSGNHARLYGMNRRGLRRAGIETATIRALRSAYRIVFQSGLRLDDALARVEADAALDTPQTRHLTAFVRGSTRGIVR